MAIPMSLIYSVSRFSAYVLLLTMHLLLVALYVLSLALHTGGPLEGFCAMIHILAVVLLVAQVSYWFCRRHAEPDNKINLYFAASMWLLALIGCIIITARAAHQPGLDADFSALVDAYTTAVSVIALSWLAFFLASVLLVVVYLDKLPGAVEVTPYTLPPARHRVVFHKNLKPLKIIEIAHDSDSGIPLSETGRYLQVPKPTRSRGAGQYPEPMKTTYNHWPEEFV